MYNQDHDDIVLILSMSLLRSCQISDLVVQPMLLLGDHYASLWLWTLYPIY